MKKLKDILVAAGVILIIVIVLALILSVIK